MTESISLLWSILIFYLFYVSFIGLCISKNVFLPSYQFVVPLFMVFSYNLFISVKSRAMSAPSFLILLT